MSMGKSQKKIEAYMTGLHPSCNKITDDCTIEYFIENYHPCVECDKLFNSKTIRVFGTLRERKNDNKNVNFYCRKCASLPVLKDEDVAGEESDRTGAAITVAANTPTGNYSSNAVEQKITSGKKRRKRKKKKKKSIELSNPSPCPSEADGSELPASSTQPVTNFNINKYTAKDYLPPQVLTKPHPLALTYHSSLVQQVHKEKMQESCLRIEKAKSFRDEKVFSKLPIMLDALDKAQEEERNGFLLLSYLQRLEQSTVKSYWAWTMKEKYSLLLEKFVLFGVEDEWKTADNDSGEDEYLQVLHKEHKRSMGIFYQSFLTHEAISKETITYMTGLNASCKLTCRKLVDYTATTYLPCMECDKVYNKAVAKIFGVVKVDRNGDLIGFKCHECGSTGEDVSDDAADAGSTPTAIEQNVEPNENSGKKRRKRKKKKKKSIDSSMSSRCLSEANGNELLPRSPQLSELETSLEDEKRDAIEEVHESKEVNNNVSINESCSLGTGTMTTETSFSSSTTPESPGTNIHNKEECDEASPIDDDLIELFLEHLWRTGSIISLDKYMDEMDKARGNTVHP